LKNGSLETSIMQQIAVLRQAGAVRNEAPLYRRFTAKIVVDVVPAALASLIVGCLLSQYQFGRAAPPAMTAEAGPASPQMMQLVREEHTAMMDYLKAQTAAETRRNAAADKAFARAAADAQADHARLAAASTVSTPDVAINSPTRLPAVASALRSKPHTAAVVVATVAPQTAPQLPLVIAQADQTDSDVSADVAPRQPDSLLAKTVHATLHVVSTIGGIPNWVAAMGDRLGGGSDPSAVARLNGTSS
jgi:hypothetical protein